MLGIGEEEDVLWTCDVDEVLATCGEEVLITCDVEEVACANDVELVGSICDVEVVLCTCANDVNVVVCGTCEEELVISTACDEELVVGTACDVELVLSTAEEDACPDNVELELCTCTDNVELTLLVVTRSEDVVVCTDEEEEVEDRLVVNVWNPEEELVVNEEEVEILNTVVLPDELVPPSVENEDELVETARAAGAKDVLWKGEEFMEELNVPVELDEELTFPTNLAPHTVVLFVIVVRVFLM